MSEITWLQVGLPADLLEHIDALIGTAGSDRSSVIVSLLKNTIPATTHPTVVARLNQVEQQLAEVRQAIRDLQQNSTKPTAMVEQSSKRKAAPISSADVPDDWIEEPYEVLQGFLETEESVIRKNLILATDDSEHDFLKEPDEVLTDFLEP